MCLEVPKPNSVVWNKEWDNVIYKWFAFGVEFRYIECVDEHFFDKFPMGLIIEFLFFFE